MKSQEAKSNNVKIYIDHFSQPSRAVWCLCMLKKIPYEIVETRIAKGANRTEEYLMKFPTGVVPAMEHDGLYLIESTAILRYLGNRFLSCDDPLYPRNDPIRLAEIDRYLNVHQTTTRRIGPYLFASLFAKGLGVEDQLPYKIDVLKAEMVKVIENLDKNVISGKKYILSGDEMTMADIFAVQEVMQLNLSGFDISKYENVHKWFKLMMSHKVLEKTYGVILKTVQIIQSTNK